MRDAFGGDADIALRVNVISFGFKYGLPVDADLVADCRFLPNPHWVPELAPLTGQDGPVREYVLAQPGAAEFLDRLCRGGAGDPERLSERTESISSCSRWAAPAASTAAS